jgi:O-antigen/teichoic acid export membrane protein
VNAFEVQGYQSLYVLSERLIAFIFGFILLYNGYGFLALLTVLVISYASSWFILYKLVSKNIIKLKLRLNLPFLKSLIKKSFPFWFTTIFMTIYFKIDTVMLSFLKDYAATGWYNASHKIIDALSFLPFVFIAVVFPVMSKFYKKDSNLLLMLYEKSFYYLVALALPLGIGITLLADRIILFVYEKNFTNSIIVLQILIWALVLIFVNYLMGYLLNSIDRQNFFTLTTGIGAVLNIILNLILIPIYSFVGAAVATVATEFFNFILLFYFASKNGFRIDILKIISKPLIASIMMGVFIFYLNNVGLFLLMPLSMLFYFLVLLLIKGVREDDKKILFSFINFRRH